MISIKRANAQPNLALRSRAIESGPFPLCALSRGSDSSCCLKSQVSRNNGGGPSVDAS